MTSKGFPSLFTGAVSATAPEPQLWREAGREPSLAEALADPLVHLVMRRDGVTPAALAAVLIRARAKLRREPCWCSAA